jgi:hypothetical protein
MQKLYIINYTVEDLHYLEQLLDGWYWYRVGRAPFVSEINIQTSVPKRLITMIRLKFADRIG